MNFKKENFNSEAELVSYITSAYPISKKKNGIKRSVLTELDLGYGIADVVIVDFKDRKSDRKNFLAYFDISILSLIQSKERVTLEDIVYITKSPEKKVYSALSSLMNEKFVYYREGYYFSGKKYSEALTDSIAIEAKLKNWKRALKQAYRYKWFSNKSFVFLPEENIRIPKENIEMFKRYGVGLASVSKKNGIKVVYAPKKEAPISDKMRIALNEHLLFKQDKN